MSLTFEWEKRYEIGVPEIDDQHKHLFRLAKDLEEDLSSANIKQIIMELYKYTRFHFDTEEKLMASLNYPEMSAHVKLHEDLLETLNKVSRQDFDERLSVTTLRMFVYKWLVDHIMNVDQKLGAVSSK
jgi:hemerythrin